MKIERVKPYNQKLIAVLGTIVAFIVAVGLIILIFKNTVGKYLFGIKVVDNESFDRPFAFGFLKRGLIKIIWLVEGLVLLFAKTKNN